MSYFNNFPKLRYPLDKYNAIVKDATLRAKFLDTIFDNTLFYEQYRVRDTDTPELISYAVYGSTQYHWIIMMANNIIDPYVDWPMPDNIFNEWVEDRYSHLDYTNGQGQFVSGADKVKYYINSDGIVIRGPLDNNDTGDSPPVSLYPITNRTFEDALNNKKRIIRIVKPEMLYDVVKQFEDIISK